MCDSDEPPFDPATEAARSVAECAPGCKRLAVVGGGAPAAAGGEGGVASHQRSGADVRLVAELLEGDVLDIAFGFDGVFATVRAVGGVQDSGTKRVDADSVHELLMRSSPRYGMWYLGRVAASLLEADAAASPKCEVAGASDMR